MISLLSQSVSIEIKPIKKISTVKAKKPSFPFRWVFKTLYRAFYLLEVFTHRKKYIILALGIRVIETNQIYHVSIDLWGYNLSNKT